MACGPGNLQGLTAPFSSAGLGTPFYVKDPLFQSCGRTNISCKVVKGQLVEVGKWPWQVSILFLGVYICGGSLIHEQWVLTAAHCLQRSLDPKEYSVMVGVQQLLENGTRLPLSRIVIHEDFNNLITEDIALLRLRDPVSWSPLVQPVCLPSTKLTPPVGTLCWTIVWGLKHNQVAPNTSYSLQEVAVKIVKSRICRQQYQYLFLKDQKKFIGKDMLCASWKWGVESCQVNSGSSLVCQVNHTWVQMGVVSWMFSCNQHSFPTLYTSTAYFTHWIKRRVAEVRFVSRAPPAFPSPVFLTGYTLLVSLGSLWLL
ncbi:putative serine protease 46 [Rousettus aegyptiacus]|uniref:putative serine protease 46 n=1 Tax=Rousettus aegyptiacus TaxID=9407 RepID=UPI00168D5A9B|nr:putative serine protease 46 [Rousettus aegyptiacus]